MKTMKMLAVALGVSLLVGASGAGAGPIPLATSCEIDHTQWGPFSREQWRYRSCAVELPSLQPYGSAEVTISPITQRASDGEVWACEYATPRWVNAERGIVTSVTTDGSVIRVLAVNLRDGVTPPLVVTVGVQCY